MKILVTGGTGFIGNNLIKGLLKENRQIRVLVRDIKEAKKFPWFNKVEISQGLLEDFNSLKKATEDIDLIYHCAALMGDFKLKYKILEKINIEGTKSLLEAAKLNKVKRFIHISSVAAMGKAPLNADENTSCNPITDYDKTKLVSEQLVKNFCIKNKISFTIIRPTMVYGPGEIKNKAKMFKYIQKGYYKIIGRGDNLVDFVYIDDLIDALISVLENKKSINQTYIISGDYPINIKEFSNLIAKYIGVKEPGHIPLFFAKIIGGIFIFLSKFTSINPPLFKDRINNLTISRNYNCSKAKIEIGYKPKIKPDEGIKKTVDWYKKKGILNDSYNYLDYIRKNFGEDKKKALFIFLVHFIFRTRKFSNKYSKKFAKNVKNKKILELGSGKNDYYLAKKFFDDSNEFIQSDINPIYGHEVIDVTKMDYKNEFDIILCINVLEHVFDFQKAIDNIYNALKSDGVAIIFVPGYYPLHDEPYDYWRFTEHSLKKLLKKFSDIKIKHKGLRKYPFGYFIEAKK